MSNLDNKSNSIICDYCYRSSPYTSNSSICNDCITAENELFNIDSSETCFNCKLSYELCLCIEMPHWASCSICDIMITRNKTGTFYCDNCINYFILFIIILSIKI